MQKRLYRSLQALLLLGMCILLASKAASGQLTYYINQRFIPLTIFGIIFLAVLAQTMFAEIKRARQNTANDEHHHEHDHAPASANLWFMLVPLLIGVLIPARPLDSSAFATKGFNTNSPLVSADSSAQLFETDSEERNILDWIKLFNFETDLAQFEGQKASVIGFVYFDESLGKNQFFVSRFVVSCCAADGFAIAMVGEWPQASTLTQDSWVLVKGTIKSITINDQTVPLILAESVQAVPAPEQPYLFP
ncbi:MAG: TIGR03943 family protein [Anaerolineales bacterium]|uniref:TIGR03943 family putative permease subunit n=1 Tax=Candidatus Villigracilis proximus TaxID=3140683 RepID=UPI003135DCAE|nr:TIGR03943 family protein [Anaerolineales bacterium]